jgi:hypothetical protein
MVPDSPHAVVKGRYLARDSGRWAALFSLFIDVVLHDQAPCANSKHLKQ